MSPRPFEFHRQDNDTPARKPLFGRRNTEDKTPSVEVKTTERRGLFGKKKAETTSSPSKQVLPTYLQSLEAFERSASYTNRKAVVQGHERAYDVSGTYTGETHQNLALMRFLMDNPSKRAEWERVIGISRESLQRLSSEYESKKGGVFGRLFGGGKEKTVAEASRGDNFFAKKSASNGAIETQGTKALDAAEKERMFMDINNEMVRAWRKDIGSRLITGGLLGAIQSRTSNLNKALRTLEGKYPGISSRLIPELQTHFAQLNELSKAYGGTETNKGKEFVASLLSPFGTERTATLRKIQSNPQFTGRFNALMQAAMSFAISAAMGSPGVYLGSINTGIKMADVRNPNKDVLSRILFETSYNQIVNDLDREHGRYNRMLADNGRTARPEYETTLRGVSSEYEEAANEGYKATGGHLFFRVLTEIFTKTDREIIVDPNASLARKYATIDKSIAKLGEKKQTDNVRTQIATLQRLKEAYGYREQALEHRERASLPSRYHEALRIMNRFGTYDDIRGYTMPSSTKKWMKIYLEGGQGYQARDKNLLMHLWDSNDTPGFQKFITAMASGKVAEYNTWAIKQDGYTHEGRGVAYGRDISRINSGRELADYLNSSESGVGRLASMYASQLQVLSGNKITVDPRDIIRAAQHSNRKLSGSMFNSGRNSTDINKLKSYNGDGWEMYVPVTYTGDGYRQGGLMRIGIKPNCSNLLLGNFEEGRLYDSSNFSSNLNFRIPLFLQFPKHGGGSHGGKTPEGEPNTPGSTPGGGGNEGTGIGSTQGGNTGFGAQTGGEISGGSSGATTIADSVPGAVSPTSTGGF